MLNDCHSLFDCIELSMKNKVNRETDATACVATSDVRGREKMCEKYELQIANLEAENRVLLSQIASITSTNKQHQSVDINVNNMNTVESVTITASLSESVSTEVVDLRQKLKMSEHLVESLRGQMKDLGAKITEMTNLYETAKQAELDEKNRIKHLDRSIRALKIEKGN